MSIGSSGSHNGHARLAPSASERWMHCTASVEACAGIKDSGSEYATEGTQAHDYAEAVLSGKLPIEKVPEDFRPHVKFYTDHCQKLIQPGMVAYVESKVPLFYSPEDTGTVDFAVASEDVVRIRDLKYGAGVLVDAQDNPQLAIYAISLIRDLRESGMFAFGPATLVDIGIVQPRHHADVPIRLWAITLADLEKFCRDIEYAAIQIREKRGLKFAPSTDACRWCPIKKNCEARAAWLVEDLGDADRSGIDLLADLPELTKADKKLEPIERIAKAGILPNEVLVSVYAKSKEIRQWLDDIEEHLEGEALRGAPVAGTKLVLGREGNRAWIDEDAADQFLKNQKFKESERYNFKLKSPTQVEAMLAEKLAASSRTRNLFESHITRSAAKPTLALESDKRPALNAAADALPDLVTDEDLV